MAVRAGSPQIPPPVTADTVRVYLREVGKVPLLTRQDEVSIARQIESAERKVLDVVVQKGYSGESDALARADDATVEMIRSGRREAQRWKNKLIEANLRLVVSVASKSANRGVGFLDLIQEGNLGLMRAVEKFEYRRGYKFSTYATWWIRQAVIRAITDQARTIRVPAHVQERIVGVLRAQTLLVQLHGREPTPDEIAREVDLPVAVVTGLLRTSRPAISLEHAIGETRERKLEEMVEDDSTPCPEQSAVAGQTRDHTLSMLECLPERERRIIRMRYGIGMDRVYTLEEIGRSFKLTRERIRQLEKKAMTRLRREPSADRLRTLVVE